MAEKQHMSTFEKIKSNAQKKDKGKREENYKRLEGLPTDLANSLANYKFYRDRLHSITRDMYQLMNGHGKCRQNENSNFEKPVHAPPGLSQAASLGKGIAMLERHAWEQELLVYEARFCETVRETERRFQDHGHFLLSHIRSFLVEQYPKVINVKEELTRIDHHIRGLHGQIDEHNTKTTDVHKEIAQLQPLKDDGTDDPKLRKEHGKLEKELEKEDKKVRKEEGKLNETQHTYNSKLDRATELLGAGANGHKINHLKELKEFMKCYKEYHTGMKKAHKAEALAQYRPVMYDQPLPRKESEAAASAEGKKKKKGR